MDLAYLIQFIYTHQDIFVLTRPPFRVKKVGELSQLGKRRQKRPVLRPMQTVGRMSRSRDDRCAWTKLLSHSSSLGTELVCHRGVFNIFLLELPAWCLTLIFGPSLT